MNVDMLKKAGINYESGVSRFMDDAKLYESVLERFLQDTTLQRASAALDSFDEAEMMKAVHEVKGVSANMDMMDLYAASSALTQLLRTPGHTWDDVIRFFEDFRLAYLRTAECIDKAAKG